MCYNFTVRANSTLPSHTFWGYGNITITRKNRHYNRVCDVTTLTLLTLHFYSIAATYFNVELVFFTFALFSALFGWYEQISLFHCSIITSFVLHYI